MFSPTSRRTSSRLPNGTVCWLSTPPWNTTPAPKSRAKPFPLHALRAPLDGVQDIDADAQQVWEHGPNRAIVVMKGSLPGRMRYFGHLGQPWQNEAPDRAGAHELRFLRAQILGDVDKIKQVAGRLDAVAHDRFEQGVDAAHQSIGEIRIGDDILKRTLDAAQ